MNKRLAFAFLVTLAFLALSVALYPQLSAFWWEEAGPFLTRSTQLIFQSLYGGAVQTVVESDGVLRVSHASLSLLVAKYCVGFDGILLYTALFLFAYTAHSARFSVRRWVSLFWAGAAFMVVVNMARITGLFQLGIYLNEWFGYARGMYLLRTVAHAHAGWLINLIAVAGYFSRALREQPVQSEMPWYVMMGRCSTGNGPQSGGT